MDLFQHSIKKHEHFGDVDEFCNKIVKELDESCENDTITSLRQVCGTLCCCKNILNSSQLMNTLLGTFDENIVSNRLEIAILSKSIVQSNKYCPEAKGVLHKCIHFILTNMKTEDEHNFLVNTWKSDCIDESFPVQLIELYIRKLPKCVEDDVLSTVEDILKIQTVRESAWTESKDVRLIKWCSLSTDIFFMVTSILNGLIFKIMLCTKQFILCISVVNSFLLRVKKMCDLETRDFVLLYPRHLQSIILVLELDPNMLSECGHELFLSTITWLMKYLRTEPIQTFGLLSHFPKWVLVLNKFLI